MVQRDDILAAVRSWVERDANPDEPILFFAGGGYSSRQILQEMEENTEFATKYIENFLQACEKHGLEPIQVIEQSGKMVS